MEEDGKYEQESNKGNVEVQEDEIVDTTYGKKTSGRHREASMKETL